MLKVVDREIEEYLNNPLLYFDGNVEGFPHRSRLTGEYYVASESYIVHYDPVWFQISIMCHCLERVKAGRDHEGDYLGLEVWMKCVPGKWSLFEVFRNTDSSSI